MVMFMEEVDMLYRGNTQSTSSIKSSTGEFQEKGQVSQLQQQNLQQQNLQQQPALNIKSQPLTKSPKASLVPQPKPPKSPESNATQQPQLAQLSDASKSNGSSSGTNQSNSPSTSLVQSDQPLYRSSITNPPVQANSVVQPKQPKPDFQKKSTSSCIQHAT